MKILLVIVLVLLPNLINAQSEYCYNGDLNIKNRTDDSQGTEFGTYETVSGVLEICYNNSYSNICLNTSDVNATEVARIACNYFGYYGKYCNFLLLATLLSFCKHRIIQWYCCFWEQKQFRVNWFYKLFIICL